ncbi:MAG: hypothetical protein EPN57_23205 [Paraburkholderia sp.]|nr:MAG: hypothetical protein EPN57_23205 [Paraburkholderia sp.]
MLSDQQTSDLIFLHDVEVEGEAFFDEMLRETAWATDQCYKLALMLQIETETKARIRSCLIKHRVFHEVDQGAPHRGREKAKSLASIPWTDFIGALRQEVSAYERICIDMRSRCAASAMPTLSAVVAHEHAFATFCTLETSGDSGSIAPLIRCLRFSPLD